VSARAHAMTTETTTTTSVLVPARPSSSSAGELVSPAEGGNLMLPAIITEAGPNAAERFVEFFTANIRNAHTRRAYARAALRFLSYCESKSVSNLGAIRPVLVAAYIEERGKDSQAQSVKQELAAVRMLFDWLVIGQVVPMNPASAVRGPRYSTKKGKTPVLARDDARRLLTSIPIIHTYKEKGVERSVPHLVGLRDRALIGLMVYSFARVGAVVNMRVGDYYQNGRRWWLRLHEKGGKFHEVPVHHTADEYLHAYIEAAGIGSETKSPLWRSTRGRSRQLTSEAMSSNDVLRMIKRRAVAAGLPVTTCCHTFRATGITAYLENGGTVEHAQQIAAHESPRTTKLYDRRSDAVSVDEIEKIVL
jgi:integrase